MARRFQREQFHATCQRYPSEKWKTFDKSFCVIPFSFQPRRRQRRTPWQVHAIYFYTVVPLHLQPFLLPSPKAFPLTSLNELSLSVFPLASREPFYVSAYVGRSEWCFNNRISLNFLGEIENFALPRASLRAVPRLLDALVPEIERQIWPAHTSPLLQKYLYHKDV